MKGYAVYYDQLYPLILLNIVVQNIYNGQLLSVVVDAKVVNLHETTHESRHMNTPRHRSDSHQRIQTDIMQDLHFIESWESVLGGVSYAPLASYRHVLDPLHHETSFSVCQPRVEKNGFVI